MTQELASNMRRNRGLSIAAALFGLMTILAAGNVLTGHGRDLAGDVVGFVLWANLLLGFGYVVAAALLWRSSPKARPLAFAIAGATVVVAVAFALVAANGTPVEPRTGAALAFRAFVWLVIGLLAPRRAV